jgi:hypothetical protein
MPKPNTSRKSAFCKVLFAFLVITFIPLALLAQKSVRENFIHIPDSVQTSIYWYWLSDNISKAGVVKDLQAMKKVGINRAFIGNIGLKDSDVPHGKVKMFTDEWWDILHTALKTATELNIEIGIFNSPGWSQSGGPWVKPTQAMRYLTSTQKLVNGKGPKSIQLEKPDGDFQDVKVIAYSAPEKNVAGEIIRTLKSDTKEATIDFVTDRMITARSISILTGENQVNATAVLKVLDQGTYKEVKTFTIDRHNMALNVGFMPYGPVAISLPETTSNVYRLELKSNSAGLTLKEIKISNVAVVERYVEKSLGKMFQDPLPYWKEYQWPVQFETSYSEVIDPKKVVDISSFMDKNGLLKWDAPGGNWIVQRFGMLPTGVTNAPADPEGTGLETDKMSKTHIESHFNAFMGEVIKRIPANDRKTWKVVVQDSYETGGQNWTDDMAPRFITQYHYDPVPYLPVLAGKVVGSQDKSDRFLWDLRRLIADRVAYDYVAGLGAVSHKHGLRTWLESYGHWGFPGEFLQYGGQADEIGGEFWSEGQLGDIENRAASSAAHIYGKTKVSAESFTAAGKTFGRFPYMMKQRGDRFFTEGINSTLFHLYIHQPEEQLPGINAWFGNEFNRHNTWFPYLDLFTAYLKRCNYMLQQGNYVADVAYFIGEDAPKMTGITDPALPKGYSFDYINAEVILKRATVSNGRMHIKGGMSYALLVLPPLETMRPLLLKKIVEMASQGLHIMGQLPVRSPSLEGFPQADNEVVELAKQLKRSKNYLNHHDIAKTLAEQNLGPDFNEEGETSILFIHRKLAGGELYFISNQKEETIEFSPSFRVKHAVPELWDPLNGEIRLLKGFTVKGDRTTVPLKLAPLQSVFLFFKNGATQGSTVKDPGIDLNFPTPLAQVTINSPWTVKFDESLRGPKAPVIFESLTDWTERPEDAIKYYAGTAIYSNIFKVKPPASGEKIYLNIGALNGMAKVKVNGKYLGGIWTAPWKLDISKALKNGENELEISVVNNWMNRLIGDSKLPPEERKTATFVNPYRPDSSLQPSGLIGPVVIERVKL